MIRAAVITVTLAAIYGVWRFHRAWVTAWDADKANWDLIEAREYASEDYSI